MAAPWVLISLIAGLIIIGLVVFIAVKQKKVKHDPDYRTLFILGVTWIPLGLATDNNAFFIIGLAFTALGLVNKDKWKKEKKWSEMSEEERKVKKTLIITTMALLLLGIAAFMFLYKII